MNILLFDYEVSIFYVISQFFALLGLILSLVSQQQRKKLSILKFKTSSTAAAILQYLFLGAWTGVATCTLSLLRTGLATYEASKRKVSKVLPILFVVLYMISGALTYESPISLLPIISSIMVTLALYLLDAQGIRKTILFGSLLWLTYDIFVFSIVGAISEIIVAVNSSIAIYRYRKKATKRHKSSAKHR